MKTKKAGQGRKLLDCLCRGCLRKVAKAKVSGQHLFVPNVEIEEKNELSVTKINRLKAAGLSIEQIAAAFKRSPSSVYYQLANGKGEKVEA